MRINGEETDILRSYRSNDAEGRLVIMLNNYAVFPKIIRKAEKKIQYKIKSEKEYLRSHARGELGVRVQTSGTSDPTFNEAATNIMIEDAFKTGEVDKGLLEYAKTIWSYPSTTFVPAEKEYDTYTLDDENVDLTGRDIVKYSYQNLEQPVTSWADMLERVVKFLHLKDRSVLSGLAYSQSSTTELASYISTDPNKLRSAIKVDEDIYFEKGTSTALKMSILRRLFVLYDLDPMDLVFYLRDEESDKTTDKSRYDLRKKYWAYALPFIQEAHCHRGSFGNVNPSSSNWISGYFGIGGFSINCVANYDEARIDFWMSSGDTEKNKKGFDLLFAHKDEIEQKLGTTELSWNRADDYKASWIIYTLKGVSIANEGDWPRMAKFHAEWGRKIADAMIPYLADLSPSVVLDSTKAERNRRSFQVSRIAKEWATDKSKDGRISVDIDKSNRSYIRFRTVYMDSVFPATSGTKSSWNTENHYYYEIVNQNGKNVRMQLAFSSRQMPKDQMATCDRINDLYPSKNDKPAWVWRVPFITDIHDIGDEIDRDSVFEQLDDCLQQIEKFETDLKEKLN